MPKKGFRIQVNKDAFLKEACKIHNNFYDYSLLPDIFPKRDNLAILCPNHGEFTSSYDIHVTKGCGCRKCVAEKVHLWTGKSLQYFIDKSNIKFDNKFTYISNDVNDKNITIICPIHGEFVANISRHLYTKTGCSLCAREVIRKSQAISYEDILSKFIAIHGNRYDYSLVEYKNRYDPIKIICSEHGIFETSAEVHLKGCNCPKCNVTGWDRTSWVELCNKTEDSVPLVYVVNCYNEEESFIKIGRTKRTIYNRFLRPSIMPYNYDIIATIEGTAEFIFDKEIELHRKFKNYSYKPKIPFPGDTECFTLTVLNEINEYTK